MVRDVEIADGIVSLDDRPDHRRLPAAPVVRAAGRAGALRHPRRARRRPLLRRHDGRGAAAADDEAARRRDGGQDDPPPARRRVIAVASGKGGVGKSSLSANLAVAFSQLGQAVGILDADIYGHSIPHILGIHQKPVAVDQMIVPPVKDGLKLMSIGFFLDGNEPVMWRGPMLHKALEQFLTDVHWGDLDILVVDMPPGTGDVVHLARPVAAARRSRRRDDAAEARARRRLARSVDGAEDEHAPARRDREHERRRVRRRRRRGARRRSRHPAARHGAARSRAARAGRPWRPGRDRRRRRRSRRARSSRSPRRSTSVRETGGILKSLPLVG